MTKSMHASLIAIGRQLHAIYLPSLAEPVPSELEDLVAQLVALESGKRGSTERSVESLQSAIAQPRAQSSATGVSIGRHADQTG